MSDTVIRVENLSKKYILGQQKQERYTALRDVLANTAKSISSQVLNPFAKKAPLPNLEEFWALKDVSFEIKQGDRVGIIGRNGAGKSTLLKVLSRITEPTTGRISIKGRVASLLEVGTGFHPELTGRENIYLNGSILGMSKFEIEKKFDEIVAFAEVEKFLDTPVKRYSSGMYVRLAFAVAAHLEPEILIIDEVLAVGDAKFQKKCLEKMKDVGDKGRTVLFVSHQMGTITQLCSKVFILEAGAIIKEGDTKETIASYMQKLSSNESNRFINKSSTTKDKSIYITEIETVDSFGISASEFSHTDNVRLKVNILIKKWVNNLFLGVVVKDIQGRKIFTSQLELDSKVKSNKLDELIVKMKIPKNFLVPGQYLFSVALHTPNVQIVEQIEEVGKFNIVDMGSDFARYEGIDYGCVFADCDWELQ